MMRLIAPAQHLCLQLFGWRLWLVQELYKKKPWWFIPSTSSQPTKTIYRHVKCTCALSPPPPWTQNVTHADTYAHTHRCCWVDRGEEVRALSLHWVENLIFLPQQLQMEGLSGETSVWGVCVCCEKESLTSRGVSIEIEEEVRNRQTELETLGPWLLSWQHINRP